MKEPCAVFDFLWNLSKLNIPKVFCYLMLVIGSHQDTASMESVMLSSGNTTELDLSEITTDVFHFNTDIYDDELVKIQKTKYRTVYRLLCWPSATRCTSSTSHL